MNFDGSILKRLRTEKGMTLEEVAKELGPSFKRQHVHAYEVRRAAPRVATLGRLAELFKVDVSIFFD